MNQMINPSDTRAALNALHAHTAIYTAPEVAEALLRRAGWPTERRRILDPGAGDGSFVVAALRMIAPLPGDLQEAERVLGLEIHDGAVAEARENVADALRDMGWSSVSADSVARTIVRQADYLVDGCGDFSPDLIAGNPPYMRFARLPEVFKALYGVVVPKLARGDLQHAFLSRCSSDLATDGAIAFVTADRWLFNESAATLRSSLGERFAVSHLERLDVDSCFYRPKSRKAGTPPRVHPVEIILGPLGEGGRSMSRAPVSIDGAAISYDGPCLADFATVRVAPYVGPLGGFLLDSAALDVFPEEFLVPALDTDDFDFHNKIVGTPKRWVLRLPRDREPTGAVRDHLLDVRHRMPKKVRLGKWWRPPENPDVPIDRPCLVVPRIERSIKVVRLEGGALPINHNLMIVTDETGTGLDRIQARLESDEAKDWILANAPPLEDGFLDIRTGMLRRVPFAGFSVR